MMTEVKKATHRVAYLDALRVVSMFAVMVIHLAATGYTEAEPESYEWFACWFYNCVTRFAVPVFVMISGAMNLDPERDVTMKSILKKIGKMMITFFSWSLVYALADALEEHALFSAGYFLSVAQKTVTGHYHMWYIYMIAGLYLATPFLRPIAADRQLLRWFIMLVFLLGHCVQLLYIVPGIDETAQAVTGSADLGIFSGYIGYYCLGYYLHHTNTPKRKIKILTLASVGLFAAAVVGSFIFGMPNVAFQTKMPHIFVYSAAVFMLFKSRAGWLEKSGRIKDIIEKLAPCSMGMYLLHPMVNFILRKAGLYALTFNPLLCVPLCSILVCAVSFVVVSLMKKIPVIRLLA